MPAPAIVQRADRLVLTICGALAFAPPLLSRFFLAHEFYLTGRGKLEHPEKIVEFFTTLNIPMPALNAAFVSRLEYYGAILLAIGLLTRLVSFLLASTMVVALLTADKDALVEAVRATGEGDITSVAPLVLLVVLSWLIIHGPGVLSVDYLIRRALGLGRRPDVDTEVRTTAA
jgi:putative oxidoreductase